MFDNEYFDDEFGVSLEFIDDITASLSKIAVPGWRLHFLVRDMREYLEISSSLKKYDGLISASFCGLLPWPPNEIISRDLAIEAIGADNSCGDMRLVCGSYAGGMIIKREGKRSAMIYLNNEAIGQLRACCGGYIAVFKADMEFVLTATAHDGQLRFSNGETWTRCE